MTAPTPGQAPERERLGRVVRETWVRWAREQADPKPSWLVPWEELGDGQREVDMRIGEAVAQAAIKAWQAAPHGESPVALALLEAEEKYLEAERTIDDYREEVSRLIADRDRLQGDLDGLRERIDSLACGLDMSARATAPSEKSETESGCADALFGLLRVDGESVADTRRRLGVPE